METIKSPAEQKVILHNVRWETYERLMDERGESRVPRFAYDRGELGIMSTHRTRKRCLLLGVSSRSVRRRDGRKCIRCRFYNL